MTHRDLVILANYKTKEFERLKDYALNLITLIEVGLNPSSVGRGQYPTETVWVPTIKEIATLSDTLLELRMNTLSPEEQEVLNEKG